METSNFKKAPDRHPPNLPGSWLAASIIFAALAYTPAYLAYRYSHVPALAFVTFTLIASAPTALAIFASRNHSSKRKRK